MFHSHNVFTYMQHTDIEYGYTNCEMKLLDYASMFAQTLKFRCV